MLAPVSRPANILVCGKIREQGEFQREIDRYLQWRAAGLVERIVFSSWVEDFHAHRAVFDALERNGVEIVISEQPRLKIVGHAFHQLKSIDAGLTLFGADDLILRTRTDKVFTGFDLAFTLNRFASAPPPGEGSPFSKRLTIQVSVPFQPYFFNDMVFLGLKRDIAKLASFDLWFDLRGTIMNPEQIIHFGPFSRMRPVVRDFFGVNPGLIYSDPALSREVYAFALGREFYCAALYTSLKDTLDSYLVGFDRACADPLYYWPQSVAMTDLLDPETATSLSGVDYHDLAATIHTRSESVIKKLLQTPIREQGGATLLEIGPAFLARAQAGESGWLSDAALDFARDLYERFPNLPHRRRLPQKDGLKTFYHAGHPMIAS
ncbi:hypothetical protein [Methylocystis parvus]|uniref:hypothetical protein n=1 Tax=Methylocystis parvus TaxID=134 RepID=UPI003C79373A